MSTQFSCDKCGRNFPCQANLEIHQYSHTSERKLACSLCGTSFSQESQVTIHEQFSCPLRKASTSQADDVTKSKAAGKGNSSEMESKSINSEAEMVKCVNDEAEGNSVKDKLEIVEAINDCTKVIKKDDKINSEDVSVAEFESNRQDDKLVTNSAEETKDEQSQKKNSDKGLCSVTENTLDTQAVNVTSLNGNSCLSVSNEKQEDKSSASKVSDTIKEVVDQLELESDNFCAICNKVFSSTSELKTHMKEHPAELSLQCSYCNKKFKHYGKFQNHMLYYCSKKNGSKSTLEIDDEDYKTEEAPEINLEPPVVKSENVVKKTFLNSTCDLCGKTFESPKSLRSHTKKHKQMHALQCKICSKVFYYAGAYVKHVEKAHGFYCPDCPLCETQCVDVNALFDHLSSHKKDLSKALIINESGRGAHNIKATPTLLSNSHLENQLTVPKVVLSKLTVPQSPAEAPSSPSKGNGENPKNATSSNEIPAASDQIINKMDKSNFRNYRFSDKEQSTITSESELWNDKLDFEFEYEEVEHHSPALNWSKKKAYTCFGCGKQCASIQDLKRHMHNHFKPDNVREPQHMCIVCGQPFSSTIKLQRHLRAHIRPTSKKLSNPLAYQAKVSRNANPYQNNNLELIGNSFSSPPDSSLTLKARKSVSFPSWKRMQSYTNPVNNTLNRFLQCDNNKLRAVHEAANTGFDLSRKPKIMEDPNEHLYDFEETPEDEVTGKPQLKNRVFQNHKNYYCIKCRESFTSISNLRSHNLTNHVPKKYSCKICNKNFFSQKFFHRHNRMHQPLNKTAVPTENASKDDADLSTKLESKAIALNRLVSSAENVNSDYKITLDLFQRKRYICDVCQKEFISLKKYKFHSRSHRRKCQICLQTLGTAEKLAAHMATNHAVNDSEKLIQNESGSLGNETATEVGQPETNSADISAPVKEESFAFPVEEVLVPNIDVQPVKLKSMSVGSKKKTFKSIYQCKTCYQKFPSLRLLQRHSSVYHRRRIRLACEICDRNIRDLFSLQQHMLVYHNSLPASEQEFTGKVFRKKQNSEDGMDLEPDVSGDPNAITNAAEHKFRYSEFVNQTADENPETSELRGMDGKQAMLAEENGNDFEAFLSDNQESNLEINRESVNCENVSDWKRKVSDLRKKRKRKRLFTISSNKMPKIQANDQLQIRVPEIFDSYPLLHYRQNSKKLADDQASNGTSSPDKVTKSNLNLVANISPLLKQISPAKHTSSEDRDDSVLLDEQKNQNGGCLPSVNSDILRKEGILASPKKEFSTTVINDSDFEILRSNISKLLTHLLGDELLSNYGHRDLPIENVIAQILDEAGFSYCQMGSDWNNPLEVLLRNIKTLIAVTVTKEVRDAIGFDCKPIDVIVKEMISFCS